MSFWLELNARAGQMTKLNGRELKMLASTTILIEESLQHMPHTIRRSWLSPPFKPYQTD